MSSPDYQRKPSASPVTTTKKKPDPASTFNDPGSSHETHGTHDWELVAPPTIEIVGHGKGQLATQTLWIPAKLPLMVVADGFGRGPRCKVTAPGGNAIHVRVAPRVLPLDGDQTYTPDSAIVLDFSPEVDATYRSTLEIELLDAPGKTFRIPIVAFSDPGQRGLAHAAPLRKAPTSQPARDKTPAPVPVADEKKRAPGPAKSRLIAASSTEHDFDEQVVGSHQAAKIFAPTNVHDEQAIAYFTVQGEGFRLTSAPSLTLPSASHMSAAEAGNVSANSPTIMYAPTTAKHHQGTLTIGVAWSDGTHEFQTVGLRGRARAIDHAPSHEQTAAELKQDAADAKARGESEAKQKKANDAEVARSPQPYDPAFEGIEGVGAAAGKAARDLAAQQQHGCDIVAAEAGAFKAVVEKAGRSIWWDLAEVALTMATAGIATHLAKNVLPRLLKASTEKVLAVEGVETFAHVLMTTPAKFSEFTTDALKEGLKIGGKKALASALAPASTSHVDGSDQPGFGHSTNKQIDFFAHQTRVIMAQGDENHELVMKQMSNLRPVHRAEPARAIALMQAIGDGFRDTAKHAEQMQANYVAPQWAAFVARMTHGSERVGKAPGADGSTSTVGSATQTQSLHPAKADGMPTAADGVLDIFVTNEYPPAKVQRARLHGASYAIGDRLSAIPLLNATMPIRFILGTGQHAPTIVTRDETGRVRVTGNFANLARYSNNTAVASTEADAIAGALVMIGQIISRPLIAWGINIVTNDATPREGFGK